MTGNAKRVMLGFLVLVLSLWPSYALATGSVHSAREGTDQGSYECTVQLVAEQVVSDRITEQANQCFESLTLQEQAQVFEEMAALRGISIGDLRRSAPRIVTSGQARPLAFWQQLIEHLGNSNPPVSSDLSFPDPTCDGDWSDVDYTFRFTSGQNVSNPDVLRSSATHLAVSAMLVWYQTTYGGISGWGQTTNPTVYVCIGDTGVSTAGGESVVRDNLKLHY